MVFNEQSWKVAQAFRGKIASEYLKYIDATNAEAGRTLVQYGNDKGFTNKSKAVYGKTLLAWKSGESVPYWAVKTMLSFIIEHGFIPEDESMLDSIVVLFCKDISELDCLTYLLQATRNVSQEELSKSLLRVRA